MRLALTSAVVALVTVSACGAVRTTPVASPSPEQLAPLWIDPAEMPRDLFWGVGGEAHAPAADAVYRLEERDAGGFSVSYDATGPDGLEWSIKIGPEAQTETVVSRILWGLGYHQPPTYYLPFWRLNTGDRVERQSEARFRPKLPVLHHRDDYWRWSDNPFLGARAFRGLLVVLLMLNSTDLKDDNNAIYEPSEPWDGASRWFVVRDLGAALGETGTLDPRRNWLAGFEAEPFITGLSDGDVRFGYQGRHRELLRMITPADVQWAARRMQRLTDRQWQDAFRAANYAESDAARFIARIKEKIADGLALRVDRRATED